jgi:hypothetical protein
MSFVGFTFKKKRQISDLFFSNVPRGSHIFRKLSDLLWGPSSLLHIGYCVSFLGVKRGVNHPLPSSAEVKERVEQYLYSPSRSSWPVVGRILLFYSFNKFYFRNVSGTALFKCNTV